MPVGSTPLLPASNGGDGDGDPAPATTISKYLSTKLKILTAFGIVCVVYIHSYNGYPRVVSPASDPKPKDATTYIEFLLVGGLLRFVVPMLFCFSGYLFFVHKASEDFPHFQFGRRIWSRVKSLGLPYLLWNIISAVLIVSVMQNDTVVYYWPWHKNLNRPTWYMVRDALMYPIPFQLWYLRDLFLMVLLTPCFHALFGCTRSSRLVPGWGLLIVPLSALVPWFQASWPLAGWCRALPYCPDLYILDLDSVCFFPVGCWLALRGVRRVTVSGKALLAMTACWVGLNVSKTTLAFGGGNHELELTLLFKAGLPFGIASVWFLYDVIEPKLKDSKLWRLMLAASPYSMWIYCSHEPLMGCALEVLQPSMGMCVVVNAGNTTTPEHNGKQFCRHAVSPAWFLLLYAFGPLLWMATLMLIGVPLSMYAPQVFEFLTGGRGVAKRPKLKAMSTRTQGPQVSVPQDTVASSGGAVEPTTEVVSRAGSVQDDSRA